MPEVNAAVQSLLDIEAIKVLKARYARLVDSKNWTELRTLFTRDCDLLWQNELPGQAIGDIHISPGHFIEVLQAILPPGAKTVHHVYAPEITLQDANNASGIWAMDDYVDAPGPGGKFRGYGHYIETYRKENNQWKIASWRLTRIRVDPF